MDKTHYEVYPPLGLFYLSSMFKEKNDVDVQIFDMHLHCKLAGEATLQA